MGLGERLISIRKSDLDSLEATIETLQNKEVMEQLKRSEKDIEKGRVKSAKKFLKEV